MGHRTFGVTGWSEGGPWALAAAAHIDPRRLRHVSSIAGGSYGAFGDNWAAEHLSAADAFGGMLALKFRPGFRLMYEALDFTATRFRDAYIEELRKAVNDYDRNILSQPDFARAFAGVDVILGPTTPTAAFELGAKTSDPVTMYLNDIYTIGANLAGLPALSLPCGFAAGLPAGLQLIGPHFSEERLLNVAHRYQRATDWHRQVPGEWR